MYLNSRHSSHQLALHIVHTSIAIYLTIPRKELILNRWYILQFSYLTDALFFYLDETRLYSERI